jgi:uncharacterized ion transporter superfamily protein YfcC
MWQKKWYQYIPHPVVMLFGMLCIAAVLSHLIPAGQFERVIVEGRERVVPGSFEYVPNTPLGIFDVFLAIPAGFKTAIDIIFIVLASGIMFGFMEDSGAIENFVGSLVKSLGIHRKVTLIVLMTFVFGALGVFVGYENNIALVPIACVLSLAIGSDLMLAAGISVAAITVGFGTSPFNPYTVGTGQRIAELPLYSGAWLRLVLCLVSLSLVAWYNVRYFKKIQQQPAESLAAGIDTEGFTLSKPISSYAMSVRDKAVILAFLSGIVLILWGVFYRHWFINQISAVFCILVVVVGLITRKTTAQFGKITLQSVAVVAPGAFMVGLATSVKAALEMGHISDTIANFLAESLSGLPLALAALGMTVGQTCMNFIIPSGSGQALATLPVLIPVGELIGMTRQSTILAFQVGDGISNLINPALGGIVAMLSMCRIPFDRWLRFIFPLFLYIWILCLLAVGLSVVIDYGPF